MTHTEDSSPFSNMPSECLNKTKHHISSCQQIRSVSIMCHLQLFHYMPNKNNHTQCTKFWINFESIPKCCLSFFTTCKISRRKSGKERKGVGIYSSVKLLSAGNFFNYNVQQRSAYLLVELLNNVQTCSQHGVVAVKLTLLTAMQCYIHFKNIYSAESKFTVSVNMDVYK